MISLVSALIPTVHSAPAEDHEVEFVVRNEAVSKISPRLFGQFLERNTGEPGPENGVDPSTKELRADIVAKLKEMQIPVIRFPGGTDIDFIDWRDMIDNVPGRIGGRPVSSVTKEGKVTTITNRFGYDDYFKQVRDPLKCETDLVVNLLDAVANRKSIHEAALDACGLLAYVNSPEKAKLPEGMPDWPAVRARNGHPEPFKINYIQLGNETWIGNFTRIVRAAWPGKTDGELAVRYHACLSEYIRVVRQIDPKIPIIIDLRMPFGAATEVYVDPFILKNANLMAYHIYQPGPLSEVRIQEKTYRVSEFSEDEIWNYWTMMPAWAGSGLVDHIPREEPGLRSGLKIACTEWNWLRYGTRLPDEALPFHWTLPAGLGVARNLHGMIRAGDRVLFATQSMLIGSRWHFASVFFDPDVPDSAHFSVQGQVTDFYRHTIGRELLQLDFTKGMETLSFHGPKTAETVQAGAALDPIASKAGKRLLIHMINRYREMPVTATVRLEGFGRLPQHAQLQTLTRDVSTVDDTNRAPLDLTSKPATLHEGVAVLSLPRPGLYLLEVRLP